MNREYDYFAECTGDMTDYLSKKFDVDLDWGNGHLNGLPLLMMMKALEPLITTDMHGAVYISNNGNIDHFELTRENTFEESVYRIDIDDKDHCNYYITQIR